MRPCQLPATAPLTADLKCISMHLQLFCPSVLPEMFSPSLCVCASLQLVFSHINTAGNQWKRGRKWMERIVFPLPQLNVSNSRDFECFGEKKGPVNVCRLTNWPVYRSPATTTTIDRERERERDVWVFFFSIFSCKLCLSSPTKDKRPVRVHFSMS